MLGVIPELAEGDMTMPLVTYEMGCSDDAAYQVALPSDEEMSIRTICAATRSNRRPDQGEELRGLADSLQAP